MPKIVINVPEIILNDIKEYKTILDEDRDDIANCILKGIVLHNCPNCGRYITEDQMYCENCANIESDKWRG